MVEFKEGATGAIVVDDRYAPLLVTSFIGEVDATLGRWYEDVIRGIIQREASEGRRTVNVHDASRATRARPEMRKFWAELSARHAATMEGRMLANVIVVSSPLLRGVVTAVGWLNPQVARLKMFGSLEIAIRESARLLEQAGTPVTLPLGGYQLPEAARRLRAL